MAEALAKTGLAPYRLSVPGVGLVTAASLVGEAGDLSRCDDWFQLRKLAGYTLRFRDGVGMGRGISAGHDPVRQHGTPPAPFWLNEGL